MLCVCFDLDGTLLLSNIIKREGFLRAARKYPEGERLMVEILLAPPGDRTAIFSRFGGLVGAGSTVPTLIEEYSRWCEQEMLCCPKRRGADVLLAALNRAGARCYINSATPTATLLRVVDARFPGIFLSVFGGSGLKVANLKIIAQHASVMPGDIVVLGDGVDDRDSAAHFGCRFIGVAGGSLENTGSAGLIENLALAWPDSFFKIS